MVYFRILSLNINTNRMSDLIASLKNPFKFRLYLLANLPIGFLAGLKIVELSEEKAVTGIRYKFLTKNPFRSVYFACLAMGAELASGILGLIHIHGSNPAVSMLVVHMDADFTKKAVGKIQFTCQDGALIRKAIEESKQTGEGRTLVATSIGTDEKGDVVATFRITWSFKVKTGRV